MKTFWKNDNTSNNLYFKDLNVGDSFVIDTPYSKGAIYSKVDLNGVRTLHQSINLYGMLEIETGKVFPATPSIVKLVPVEVHIDSDKPDLYK